MTAADFQQILTQSRHSLTHQYAALLSVDGTELIFEESGVVAIAEYAEKVNQEIEDIGARRLHTVLESVLQDVSFSTGLGPVLIDGNYVKEKIEAIVEDIDLSRYVL